MIIIFQNRDYESNDDADMVRLQSALDRWDIGQRIKSKSEAKRVAALLKDADPDRRSTT